MAISAEDEKLKALVKAAVIDAFEEQRELVKDIVIEAMEDLALERAIKDGLNTDSIPRDEVFKLFEKTP